MGKSVIVGVYCRPPDQEEQEQRARRSLTLTDPDPHDRITTVSAGTGTAQHGISHAGHYSSDNFLIQV